MFSKKNKSENLAPSLLPDNTTRARAKGNSVSLLAEGCLFQGKMILMGETRVGGHVEGLLQSEGQLTIESGAFIKGDVLGSVVTLQGVIEGRVFVRDLLHITSTGRMRGEVSAKRLVVDDGAKLEGTLRCEETPLGSADHPLKEAG